MKRITIVLLIAMSNLWTTLQAQNLDKMNEAKRQQALLKIAKAAILKYGSDYYREYGKPEIAQGYVTENNPRFPEKDVKMYKNRSYYTVKYFYDKTEEAFPEDYSSWVFIWGDTGKAFKVYFGHGLGLNIEGIEKSNKNTRDGVSKMSWQKRPPGAFEPPKPKRVEVEYIPKKK